MAADRRGGWDAIVETGSVTNLAGSRSRFSTAVTVNRCSSGPVTGGLALASGTGVRYAAINTCLYVDMLNEARDQAMTDREYLTMRLAEGRGAAARDSGPVAALRRLIGALAAVFRRRTPLTGACAPDAADALQLQRILQRRRRCYGRPPSRRTGRHAPVRRPRQGGTDARVPSTLA